MTHVSEQRRVSRLIAGALLLLLGGLFALQNLGIVHAGGFGDYWPLVLVWVGLSRMLAPGRPFHFASGLAIFLIGVFFQLERFDILWIRSRDFWPLLLIAVGFGLIADSMIGKRIRSSGITPTAQSGPEVRS